MHTTEKSKSGTVFVVIFLASLVSNTYQSVHSPHAALGLGYETVAVARNLAFKGSFANPFWTMPTGPTALLPPLYPAFLASLLKLFGDGVHFAVPATLFTIIVHSAHAALLPSMSRLLFRQAAPGMWAALILVVLPIYRVEPQSETILYATGVMLLCLLSARQIESSSPQLRSAAATGVLAGILLLLNPASLCIFVPWMVFLLWWRGVSLKRGVVYLSLFTGAALLLCIPWSIRNYYRLGSISFIRNGLGLELYISNNDLARPLSIDNYQTVFPTMHPNLSKSEAEMVRDLGETAYLHSRMTIALRWIRNNPSRFLELSLRRAVAFWFPSPRYGPVAAYAIWAVTLASFLGAAVLIRRRIRTVWFILAVWMLFPIVYYSVQSHPNYRYPILWLTLLTAGYAIDEFGHTFRRALPGPSGRRNRSHATAEQCLMNNGISNCEKGTICQPGPLQSLGSTTSTEGMTGPPARPVRSSVRSGVIIKSNVATVSPYAGG